LTTAVYLAEAFCRQCTPTALFNIFFWLAGGQHRHAGEVCCLLLARLLQLGRQSVHLRALFEGLSLRLPEVPALPLQAHQAGAAPLGQRA